MKEILTTIKTYTFWIFGIAGMLLGFISFFATYGIIPKVFGGILLVIGIYIIPKINERIDIGVKPKYILIAFLIGLFGFVLTFDDKPELQNKGNQYFVTAIKLNVRKGQGANCDVVYQLNKRDSVEVISKNGDWAEISTSKGTAYASIKYLSNEIPKKSNKSDWGGFLVIGGIILYALFFKNGNSSSGSTSKPKDVTFTKPSINESIPIKNKTMSDVRVKSNNYLETFDENGQVIRGSFLLSSNERLVGFTSTFYVTVKTNNYLTVYNPKCERISGMFLGSPNEHFHNCAGNVFSTLNSNHYLTNYDVNCKRQNGRFI